MERTKAGANGCHIVLFWLCHAINSSDLEKMKEGLVFECLLCLLIFNENASLLFMVFVSIVIVIARMETSASSDPGTDPGKLKRSHRNTALHS